LADAQPLMITEPHRPISVTFPPATRTLPLLLLVLSALTWPAVLMHGQTLHERILADEAQDRANEIIRQERALRNMPQGPSDSGSPTSRVRDEGPSESSLKVDRVNAIMKDARAASDRGDLREALRLAREALPIAQSAKFKAELENWIQALETEIARNDLRTAADVLRVQGNAALERGDTAGALALFQRALATDPNSLSDEGKKRVANLAAQLNAAGSIQRAFDNFAQTLRPVSGSSELDFMAGNIAVVDARDVPSGLPKSIDDAIPHTPTGERVRKGFQAVADSDWLVAKAWFEDALNHEPGNPGLKRLVELARFTLEYRLPTPAATEKISSSASTDPVARPDLGPKTPEVAAGEGVDDHAPAKPPVLSPEAHAALVTRAEAAREAYNQKSGEHDFLIRLAARSMAERARSEAAFRRYNEEHGTPFGPHRPDQQPSMFDRMKAQRSAVRGEGYSKAELDAQFQQSLLDFYIEHDGQKPVDSVGGSTVVDDISLGGKG
jgi:tetratricopeptide (TPR) repeat protein